MAFKMCSLMGWNKVFKNKIKITSEKKAFLYINRHKRQLWNEQGKHRNNNSPKSHGVILYWILGISDTFCLLSCITA